MSSADSHPLDSGVPQSSAAQRTRPATRRGTPRTPHRLPCKVRVFDAGAGDWVTRAGQTVNISPGGLAVQVGLPVPIGARIEAVVPRFDADPWCLSGTVIHTRRVLTGTYEVGIRVVECAAVAP